MEHAGRVQILDEVHRIGQIRFAFVHALIPFTLRESLGGVRLQRLHQRAAIVIESRRPHDVEALAYHFTAAGERDQAMTYSRRAAERAGALYAYDTAMQYLQTILSLLEPGEQPETRLAVFEQIADLHRLRNAHAEAIPVYQEALALWHELPDADRLIKVRLLRRIGETVFGTEAVREVQPFEVAARAALHEGVSLMADAPPHAETVRLLISLSHEIWRMRVPQDWDAAEQYARAAVEMAEQLDEPSALSGALDALAVVYAARGLFNERVQIALRRVALSREASFGDMRERVHLLNEAGTALIDIGAYAQAVAHLQEAERLASQIHARDGLVHALDGQAICAFRLDHWDEVVMEEKLRALGQRQQQDRLVPLCRHIEVVAALARTFLPGHTQCHARPTQDDR